MITPREKAELYRQFDRVLGQRMEAIFTRSMVGEVRWDADRWEALLDWISGSLRRRIYRQWMDQNPGGHIEQSPAYGAFEAFDRARMAGQLTDGALVRVAFSAVQELGDLVGQALGAFRVEFKEAADE